MGFQGMARRQRRHDILDNRDPHLQNAKFSPCPVVQLPWLKSDMTRLPPSYKMLNCTLAGTITTLFYHEDNSSMLPNPLGIVEVSVDILLALQHVIKSSIMHRERDRLRVVTPEREQLFLKSYTVLGMRNAISGIE